MRKVGRVVAVAVPLGLAGWMLARMSGPPPRPAAVTAPALAPPARDAPYDDELDDEGAYAFRVPSGEPTALTCEDARLIVEEVREGLAYEPAAVPAKAFATSTADWLDPHGLLSLAKDAPTTSALAKVAPELLADIEGRRDRGCAAAAGPGAALERWAADLRAAFDRGRAAPGDTELATATLEPLPPTGLARKIAEQIGQRVGAFEAAYGAPARPFADDARRRFFPPLDAQGWTNVVLASAVRAYVPLVDPHGEWAPFDEEARIYEIDLSSRPPPRLWARAVPTAIGVRLLDWAAPPLAVDDVVLEVAGRTTVGLPLEQVDQLGFASGEPGAPLVAVVLRDGAILRLTLGAEKDAAESDRDEPPELPATRVAYGDGDVLLIEVKDVRDDLGDELADRLDDERARGRRLEGVVLDLRGNGGGSTDGAIGALSLFLPGAPLFAMKRRDGTIEIDRAPVPRERDRWTGPVATLVDGTTASAAEMIAGALAAYRRGPTVGTRTFGKGCAQEYVDDDARAGVLRLTTLVYALPDGSPVQRVGLVPTLRFPFEPAVDEGASEERESTIARSAPPWRGPDLRGRARVPVTPVAWPSSGGEVGPCKEADVCRAIKLLGAPKRPTVAKHH